MYVLRDFPKKLWHHLTQETVRGSSTGGETMVNKEVVQGGHGSQWAYLAFSSRRLLLLDLGRAGSKGEQEPYTPQLINRPTAYPNNL